MPSEDEAAIRQLLNGLCDAWNRGDAQAFAARYRDDGTFTNVFGTLYSGRDEFERRHADVFGGFLKGTRIAMTVSKLRFIPPGVAVADIDMAYSGFQTLPPGIQPTPHGVHSSLLMVLAKQADGWWIAAYHNIWRTA